MAFDLFSGQEDQLNQLNQTAQGTGGNTQSGTPVTSGGGQSLGPQTQVVSGSGQKTGTPSSSGQFTNLQNYLDANKSLGFGGQFANQVQGTVDQANQAQQNTGTQFQNQVDQNTVQEDKNLVGEVGTNPTDVANNSYDQYEKMLNAQYQGPKSVTETPELYSSADQATQNAAQVGQQTKTESGRDAFLNQKYGAGAGRYDYGSGLQKLDNLLIQYDPNASEKLLNAQNNAAQSSQNWQALQNQLNQYANQGQQTTQNTRTDARNAVGVDNAGNYSGQGPIADTMKQVNQTLTQRQADWDANVPQVQQGLQNKNLSNLTSDQRAQLNLDNTGKIWNLDPSQYLNTVARGDLTASSVATPDQLAKIQALTKLGNLQNTFLDPSKVGQDTNNPLYSYNNAGFQDAINQAATNYQNQLNNSKADVPSTWTSSPNDTNMGLMDAINQFAPVYQQQLAEYNRYGGSTGPGSNAQFIANQYLDPYQKMIDQLDTLQNNSGYTNYLGGYQGPKDTVTPVPGAPIPRLVRR